MPTTHVLPRTAPSLVLPLIAALALAGLSGMAAAASFTISNASTTAQSLAAGQAGSVTATGTLTVSGSTNAVGLTGNNATLTNLGSIKQTGTGRVVRDNAGVTGIVVTNGALGNAAALMQSADADVIQFNVANGSVVVHNYGSMISLNASAGGAQAIDFNAVTTGATTLNNYAGGLMKAYEADAVRTAVNGIINNAGHIWAVTTTGSSSDAIDMQTNSGAQINNGSTGLIQGGRHGITGSALNTTTSFSASINNVAGGVIQGDNGAGLNFDGFNAKQLVTVVNGGSIIGTGVTGDGDGVDVDGLVNLTNTGLIRSVNAFSAVGAGLAYSEGLSIGGGTVTNSGTIEGLVSLGNNNAVGRGITLVGNDITTGPLAGTREAIYGNAVVINQAGGLIRGQGDSALVVGGPASGYTVTINNQAGGTFQGGSASFAAIRTGADNDTLTNGGLIDGRSSGLAIDLGGGNNTLHIVGPSAVVLGDINGGTGGQNLMTINPGAGNRFDYAGRISNFSTVDVQSGRVTFTGQSSYTGSTTLSGGTLALDGAGRLSADSALVLAGGTLEILNAAGALGQSFSSLTLSADSSIVLNGSSLSFNGLGAIAGGAHLSITEATSGNAFRVLGNLGNDASFLSLLSGISINGLAASYSFDGVYTDVSAVPEPSQTALLLSGLGLFGVVVRRRRAASAAGAQREPLLTK